MTDSKESVDGKRKNDAGIGSSIGLDEIVYASIDRLRKNINK